MATLSFTLSQLAPNLKATHTGSCVVGAAGSISATICPSSIIHLCQVPNNATLTDYWLKFGGQLIDTQALQIGTSFSPSGIMAATTVSATFSISTQSAVGPNAGVFGQGWLRAPGGPASADLMPVRVSLSDDALPAQIWTQLRVSKTISGSFFMTFLLWYTMDGLIGHTSIR